MERSGVAAKMNEVLALHVLWQCDAYDANWSPMWQGCVKRFVSYAVSAT